MKRLRAVLGLCLAVALGGLAFAAEPGSPTLERIVKNQKVRVGMSGTQPPFNMKSRRGQLIGFDVDVANDLSAAMGVKLELVQKPFAELLPALERGEVDVVMSGVTMTPERSLKFNFAGPYYVSGKSVLTKSKELASYGDAAAAYRAHSYHAAALSRHRRSRLPAGGRPPGAARLRSRGQGGQGAVHRPHRGRGRAPPGRR